MVIGMETQNQIKRTLTRPDAIKYINHMLDADTEMNRTQLADHLCDKYGFLDPRGNRQRSGCLVAIRELELKDHFSLPKTNFRKGEGKGGPKRLGEPVSLPVGVPDKVGKIKELRLILVETEEQTKIWNELLHREHPVGTTTFFGRQIRYLVKSEHGWLGAIGFCSAAIYLEDRDKWIGWDHNTRSDHLQQVVNMSRFLIRPSVSCKNLASHVLGMVMRGFSNDFETRYSYHPLIVESFVDTSSHLGTCYKAANFELVGCTKGRGRQGKTSDELKTIKDIYIYPLVEDFRTQLGLPEDAGQQNNELEAIEITSGIDGQDWAENEFGNAKIGDKRLTTRLIQAATDKAESPGSAYCSAAGGDQAKVKGYYRMIDKPDDSAVTMENILLPHRNRTIQRMKDQEIVLCIQDGSDLNYSSLSNCKGLGDISKNQTGAKSQGLHLHSTIAVTTGGLPLGVLRSECTAPVIKVKKDKKKASNIPIEEKKTFCWLESIRDCEELKTHLPDTTVINVMDREGDFFELFDDQRNNCENVELLVRAKHDRKITGEGKLFELIRSSPVQTRLQIEVPRQSSRPKKSKQKARKGRPMRTAEVTVHYRQINFNPPSTHKDKDPIPLWAICVREDSPPKDQDPVEWFLLTTIKIESVEDAVECIRWYCLRWRIEDWHRVMKSGCNIEKKQHKTAERLKRSLAIDMVIAWRIMLMTLLGRETPELPPEVMFTDVELKVLTAYSQKKN